MKQKLQFLLLIIILSSATTVLKAQTEIDINANGRSYSTIFDSLSTSLIPSRIPYGTLYDRVYQWSGFSEWNNGDTTSVAQLFQGWYDAEQSVINPATRPNNYDLMRSSVQQQLFSLKLPIVTLNFQFAYFDSTSAQDGRLTVTNGMIKDNNLASPYLTKQVTIAGIATDNIVAYKNYALQFGDPLILNNTSTTIQNIVVNNLTAETQYTLTAGTSQIIQFAQPGSITLRFTVKLSNGNSYITNQIITVTDINAGSQGTQQFQGPVKPQGIQSPQNPTGLNCSPTNELVQSDIPFKGYTEIQATNSFADYHIYYHTQTPTSTDCEKVLRKPIIVLDGFDPKDQRNYTALYNNYLINNETQSSLGDALRAKGYDLIILNFPLLGETIFGTTGVADITIPSTVKINGTSQTVNLSGRDGGADYIERDAFLLVKLIQQVNAILTANGSAKKIVIVGPSMGGQISRYALAYMEKQQAQGVPNMNHNCRLWVSFDSPHDGANIPMAVQETLRFFGTEGEQKKAKDSYDGQLRSPAARQMLIEQLDGQNSTATFNTTYYNNLRANGLSGSNGFPLNLRKVSLLNGTGNSIQTYGDGAEVRNGVGRKTFLNIKVFELIENFMPSYGQSLQIVKEKVTIPRFLSITFISKLFFVTNINSHGSMDAVQGSTNNTIDQIYTQFSSALKDQKVRQTWTTHLYDHCFIPSISALGFKNAGFNWNTRVDNRNLLCNHEIYFDNYYIPKTNQSHIYLNTDNINWLMQEFDKGQSNCPTICSFAIIGGADLLCTNDVSTYSLDVPIPAGATVQWNTTSNLQIISSTNNSVTVKGLSTNSASITANIINPCGANLTIAKQITAGKPVVSGTYSYNGQSHPLQYYNGSSTYNSVCNSITANTSMQISGATSINWQRLSASNSALTWNQNGNDINFYFWSVGQTEVFRISAINGCGTTSNDFGFKSIDCSGGGGCLVYQLSPNPATSTIQIGVVPNIPAPCDPPPTEQIAAQGKASTLSKVSSTKDRSIQSISIYDSKGNLEQQHKYGAGNKQATLNVSNLPSGIYLVQITDGVYTESHRVVIGK